MPTMPLASFAINNRKPKIEDWKTRMRMSLESNIITGAIKIRTFQKETFKSQSNIQTLKLGPEKDYKLV